jgi:hypothetical protein
MQYNCFSYIYVHAQDILYLACCCDIQSGSFVCGFLVDKIKFPNLPQMEERSRRHFIQNMYGLKRYSGILASIRTLKGT